MVNLYIEGQLIDQYDDESVEINSSVLDVQDITKNTGDYSKSFTIPTSKRNNKTFKHWYNATIDGGFDARTRVKGSIDIDGVPFKTGKWLLRSVKMIKGVPDSYVINFFGETASLGQIIGKDTLKDLDFNAYDHSYNAGSIKVGLEDGFFDRDVIYTLMCQKGLFYNSDPLVGDIIDISTETVLKRNISSYSNDGSGLKFEEVRPSIRILKIIEAIEDRYDITFSRDFFDTSEFSEIYMWLCPDSEGEPIGSLESRIDFVTNGGDWMDRNTDIATYPAGFAHKMILDLNIFPEPGQTGKTFKLTMRNVDTGEVYKDQDFTVRADGGGHTMEWTIETYEETRVEFLITPTEQFSYSANVLQRQVIGPSVVEQQQAFGGVTNQDTQVVINNMMPEMDIMKFLKGLFQMFKLVVVGEEDGSYYVNSLDAYYLQGQRHDITKYVNYAQIDVERGEILGELDFRFEEPTSLLAKQFKDDNGVGYGDSKVKLKDAEGEPFDGDTLTVELPFETVVYERLIDGNGGYETALQIGSIINYSYEPVSIKPHLHYSARIAIGNTNTIKYNSTDILDTFVFLPFTHFGAYNPSYSLLFEAENSTYTSDRINTTLYSNHYEDYVQAIFNVKRRTIKVEAKLPIQIITILDLNDVITINSLDYRINNYKYNLLTGLTDLELINGFDKYETNELLLLDDCFRASNEGGVYYFNIPFIQDYTITSTVVDGEDIFVYPSTPEPNQLRIAVAPWGTVSGRGVDVWQRKTQLTFTDSSGNSQGGMCVIQTNRGN